MQHQRNSETKDRACCSTGVANLEIQCEPDLIDLKADDLVLVEEEFVEKDAYADDRTCSAKSDEATNRTGVNGKTRKSVHKIASAGDSTCSTESKDAKNRNVNRQPQEHHKLMMGLVVLSQVVPKIEDPREHHRRIRIPMIILVVIEIKR